MKAWKALVAAAAMVSACSAQALATASIEITNQTPWQVYAMTATDYGWHGIDDSASPVPFTGQRVAPGFAKGFEFDYAIHVSDDGLPAWPTGDTIEERHFGGVSLSPEVGRIAIPFDGHEVAVVTLGFYGEQGCTNHSRQMCAPYFDYGLPFLALATDSDDLSQSRTLAGHAMVYVGCADVSCGGDVSSISITERRTVIAVSATGAVSPVPEPQTWALLFGGLVFVGWHVRRAAR